MTPGQYCRSPLEATLDDSGDDKNIIAGPSKPSYWAIDISTQEETT